MDEASTVGGGVGYWSQSQGGGRTLNVNVGRISRADMVTPLFVCCGAMLRR